MGLEQRVNAPLVHPDAEYLQHVEGQALVSTEFMHHYLRSSHFGIQVFWIYLVGVMCAVLAAMLIAALLNQQVALLTGVVMAVATALLVENPVKFAIIALFGSFIGVNLEMRLKEDGTGIYFLLKKEGGESGFFFAIFILHAIYVDNQQDRLRRGSNGVPPLFASHDVIVKGTGLLSLLHAMTGHQVTSVRELARSARFHGQAAQSVREIEETFQCERIERVHKNKPKAGRD